MLAVTKMELGTHIYAWDTGDIGERTELKKECYQHTKGLHD